MSWAIVIPIIDPSVRGLCRRAYPGHSKGCPNFGHKADCPPQAPLIETQLDLKSPVYAIYNVFDFAAHVSRMRALHPMWSPRQLACCLYWQPVARKQLRGEISAFLRVHRGLHIIGCPEAQGVNLTATMASIGIALEWPPRNVAYQIVLAGRVAGLRHCL